MAPSNTDPHQLRRFLEAQHSSYAEVLGELREGQKRTHWMWYIFPQIEGLGASTIARHFAIRSPAEANAYIEHPILGARLREATQAVLQHDGKTAFEMLGSPDDLKFLSSMTLFELASGESVFGKAIDKFYSGRRDGRTLKVWSNWKPPA